MLLKIIINDICRKKIIHAALFLFIALPAFMISGGADMIAQMSGSLDNLFEKASVPHFVQMHSGIIDRNKIEDWMHENNFKEKLQITEMLNIDGSDVFLGQKEISQADSVMDLGFVRQNESFDFLLDLDNRSVNVSKGEIAVPLYFRKTAGLSIGSKVFIIHNDFSKEFIISDFIRDAQMNPSIIHSKRFVLNPDDLAFLKGKLGEIEYLIEFRLSDSEEINEFTTAYESSGLPSSGPAVNYELFRVINVLTDSIAAVVVILVSLLFSAVAVLCLRFTLLAAVEEDYREIGVMKAIGFPSVSIKRIYLGKYTFLAAAAVLCGYAFSFFLNNLFTSNILLYMGPSPASGFSVFIPFLSAGIVFLIVYFSCLITLNRFNSISAVTALRAGNRGGSVFYCRFLSLKRSRILNTDIFLGLRDVLIRFRLFWIPAAVFFVCTFIILVPLNFLNTIKSPEFISYLGIGKSDIRIDLRQTENRTERFNEMVDYIEKDPDVLRFAPMITSRCKVEDADGTFKNINVETGDFTVFPLEYLEGRSPSGNSDIALSLLNARDSGLKIGDNIVLESGGDTRDLRLCGIYQDVTNGGYTAKAAFPPVEENIVWTSVSIDMIPDSVISLNEKVEEYSSLFYPARVTHTAEYVSQTLGSLISRLGVITLLIIATVTLTAVLITALFLKMIMAKDASQVAIFTGIGFSMKHIRIRYNTSALSVLCLGIIAGTFTANSAGESLVSAVWSLMGASGIKFIINPLHAYILVPLLLICIVSAVTAVSLSSIKNTGIASINAE